MKFVTLVLVFTLGMAASDENCVTATQTMYSKGLSVTAAVVSSIGVALKNTGQAEADRGKYISRCDRNSTDFYPEGCIYHGVSESFYCYYCDPLISRKVNCKLVNDISGYKSYTYAPWPAVTFFKYDGQTTPEVDEYISKRELAFYDGYNDHGTPVCTKLIITQFPNGREIFIRTADVVPDFPKVPSDVNHFCKDLNISEINRATMLSQYKGPVIKARACYCTKYLCNRGGGPLRRAGSANIGTFGLGFVAVVLLYLI